MTPRVRVLVVGLGHMGAPHAIAYHRNPGFEIAGLMSRNIRGAILPDELRDYPLFDDFDEALAALSPDAVSINSWPDTHAGYAIKSMEAGAHVFLEKPIAPSVEDAERVVAAAVKYRRKLLVGYILRVHPSWTKSSRTAFAFIAPTLMRARLSSARTRSSRCPTSRAFRLCATANRPCSCAPSTTTWI